MFGIGVGAAGREFDPSQVPHSVNPFAWAMERELGSRDGLALSSIASGRTKSHDIMKAEAMARGAGILSS